MANPLKTGGRPAAGAGQQIGELGGSAAFAAALASVLGADASQSAQWSLIGGIAGPFLLMLVRNALTPDD